MKVIEAEAAAIDLLIACAIPMPFTNANVNGIPRYTSPANTIVEVHPTDMPADRKFDIGVEAFFSENLPYWKTDLANVLPESIPAWHDGYRAPGDAALPREDHEHQKEKMLMYDSKNARLVHQTPAFSEDSDLDPKWMQTGEVGTWSDGITTNRRFGYSTGDSGHDPEDTTATLLGQIGEYAFGPHTEKEAQCTQVFSEKNWHAKTWTLLARNLFCGPIAGPTCNFNGVIPTPTTCFMQLLDNKIQQKLVRENNAYAK
jgi:hypothetical protein